MRGRSIAVWLVSSAIALGCAQQSEDEPAEAEAASDGDLQAPTGTRLLEPQERLVRIAMALRARRPTAEELTLVGDDPEALPSIVEGWLDTPEFGATIRDLHNESLLVLADTLIYPAGYPLLDPLQDADPYALNRSITEAPLRLIEHVVMNDRPYTEIVTADYTLANGHVATVWGLPYAAQGSTWEVTTWNDGRPAAGILSDSWLYQRHRSTPSNGNRGRANAISRALLCYDFLDRDIELDASVNLSDPEAVANAVVDNVACASCHQALDPLAGFFGDFIGIYVPAELPQYGFDRYPFSPYIPGYFAREYGVNLRRPSYFGIAGNDLRDLGAFIAIDPRFSQCAAKRFYAYFHQVDLDDVPPEAAAALQETFVSSGMNAKALAKAVVLDDAFALADADDSPQADLEARGVFKTRPLQLASFVEHLTGVRWRTRIVAEAEGFDTGDVDLLADSFLGYHVLMGGIDAVFVTRPSHTYSATASLVLRGLATEAAGIVVPQEFAEPDRNARRLFTELEASDTDEARVREQIAALHLAVYGRDEGPNSAPVSETYALFTGALAQSGDPVRAWTITLTAMLQDMRVAYH